MREGAFVGVVTVAATTDESLAPLALHLRQALTGESGGGLIRVLLNDLVQCSARLRPILQLIVAIADLEQRIRHLARRRTLIDDGTEAFQRIAVFFRHI